MNEKSISRAELLTSFGSLATQFTSSLTEAQSLEQAFEATRAKLVLNISRRLKDSKESLSEANPLQSSLSDFVTAMTATSREWDAKVAGRKKGVEFRQGFEDSMLVFVGGKVKSGKSSLGNYMAWGHTDPTDIVKRQTPTARHPKYESHEQTQVEGGDSHDEAVKRHEFRVGATEATSSIQSFSLSGLTWVDSPGLHSLKEENGNLAREYLDHADLILYTMKSDAPGRKSDLEEIQTLIRKDKKIMLLLTGSDDIEEDVGDSNELIQRIVMKDAERRTKQRDYVRSELKELPDIAKLEIISISSRYAQEHADDEAAFFESGIGYFCATLQDICQSDGVKIKQRVPMRNLSRFLDECANDLEPYKQTIDSFKPKLRQMQTDLEKQLPVQVRKGQSDLVKFTDKFFDNLANRRADADEIQKKLKKFRPQLEEKFNKIWDERLLAISDELVKEFQANVVSTIQSSRLSEIPDFKIETITEQVADGTRSGTKKRNSLLGTLIGGAIGFVASGFNPGGAALGASIGGTLGGVSGDSASVRYRDVQVTVGDNLQDIRRQLLDSHTEALDRALHAGTDALWKEFSAGINLLLKNLSAELDEFESALQKIIDKTQLTL